MDQPQIRKGRIFTKPLYLGNSGGGLAQRGGCLALAGDEHYK